MTDSSDNTLALNRKALHNYFVLEKFEAGIALTGPEVKSCRQKEINIGPSYASLSHGQLLIKNLHIAPYKNDNNKDQYKPDRERKLLLHQKEIAQIDRQIKLEGTTLIPISLYLKKGKIKVQLALCKGKKLEDKRHLLKAKAQNLDIKRALKKYQ